MGKPTDLVPSGVSMLFVKVAIAVTRNHSFLPGCVVDDIEDVVAFVPKAFEIFEPNRLLQDRQNIGSLGHAAEDFIQVDHVVLSKLRLDLGIAGSVEDLCGRVDFLQIDAFLENSLSVLLAQKFVDVENWRSKKRPENFHSGYFDVWGPTRTTPGLCGPAGHPRVLTLPGLGRQRQAERSWRV